MDKYYRYWVAKAKTYLKERDPVSVKYAFSVELFDLFGQAIVQESSLSSDFSIECTSTLLLVY